VIIIIVVVVVVVVGVVVIIIIINCKWDVTLWQWLFYMYTNVK
jgi:hypothetical protein